MKRIRILTLKYDDDLAGFPEKPLIRLQNEGRLLECREYFFEIHKIPHLVFVVTLETGLETNEARRRKQGRTDPWHMLPEERKGLYKSLKEWRLRVSEEKGIPVFTILRNHQLADICIRAPKTLSELKTIPGIGESTIKKYGKDIIDLIPESMSEWIEPVPDESLETSEEEST